MNEIISLGFPATMQLAAVARSWALLVGIIAGVVGAVRQNTAWEADSVNASGSRERSRCIVCDEPISALDVSIRAQILNLLMDLRRSYGLTYLFIAHDLTAVRHISDRIAVMYIRKIVEIADSAELCARPLYPYTQGLIAFVPVADPKRERSRARPPMLGESPSPMRPPSGCRFHPCCPIAIDRCARETPRLLPVHEAPLTRFAACHRIDVASATTVSA